MDILDKIEDYINENKKQDALTNTMTAITSASTDAQLTAASQAADEFINQYGHDSLMKSLSTFFGAKGAGKKEKDLYDKFSKAIKRQRGKIDQAEMRKMVQHLKP